MEDVFGFSGAPAPPTTLARGAKSIAESSPRTTDSKTVSLHPKSRAAVNLKLLSQRIDAHNLSVAAIEDELRSREQWDLRGIETTISEIENVMFGRELWSMYWELLDPRGQRRIGSVASLSPSLGKLRQRIFETQVAADVDPRLVSHLSKNEAKSRLSAIDRQVSGLLQQQ